MKMESFFSKAAIAVASLCLIAVSILARVPEEVNYSLVGSNNAFGFNIFDKLYEEDRSENVFISPASIAIALQLCYNGADGNTKAEMARVLGIEGTSLGDLNYSNSTLIDVLSTPEEDVTLQIANSVWARNGVPFEREFIETAEKSYGALAREIDFGDPKSVDIINEWVSSATNGKIDRIISQLNPLDILLLINAVYFKGVWSEPFRERNTKDEDFHLPGGGTATVPMMSKRDDYSYLETENFQAVKLPYGRFRFEMLIFLPSEDYGLDGFIENLNAKSWNRIMNAKSWGRSMGDFNKRDGILKLPRFKIEYSAILNDALFALGMNDAFDDTGADFPAMTPVKPVWIGRVIHKTYLDVDEKGTEAAGVTAITMSMLSAPMKDPPKPFVMIVDRPFFCAIRDSKTGAILFMGAINKPVENNITGFTPVEGENKGEVKLYALSTCIWSKKAKKLIEDMGVGFEYIYVDLLDGPEREEITARLKSHNPEGSFPTIVIDGERVIAGFKEDRIREELGQ